MLAGAGPSLVPPAWSSLCPPRREGDEQTVCASREPQRSPYRLPVTPPRPFGERGTASVSAERNRLLGPDVGGLGSCSAWGAGGWTGCSFRQFKDNVNQAAGSRDARGRAYATPP